MRDKDCDKYVRMVTCLEILSGEDKNDTKSVGNLTNTLTFLSKLSEAPVQQITKSEVSVSKIRNVFLLLKSKYLHLTKKYSYRKRE